MATSAWLIARAAQQPPVLYLMVAVVAVRTFGIGRGVLRYLERLVSHDAAFRVLGQIREKLVAHLAVIAPAGLPLWRKGDLLARTVDDVDDAGRRLPPGSAAAGRRAAGRRRHRRAGLPDPAGGRDRAGRSTCCVACVVAPLITARRTARIERRGRRSCGPRRTRLVTEMLDELAELTVLGAMDARLAELAGLETASRPGRRRNGPSGRCRRRAGGRVDGRRGLAGRASSVCRRWSTPTSNPVLLAVIVLTPLALTDTVQAVGVAASTLRRSSAAVRRLFAVLDAPPVTAPAPAAPGAAAGSMPAGRGSRCAGSCARWPGADRDALSGIDLDLAPGRRIVVLGESGSGKSTLLAVLLGFLTPTAGQHHHRRDRCRRPWIPTRSATLFGWCDQRAHLFDSTPGRERPARPMPAADDDEIAAALRAAGAGAWLDGLPDGSRHQGRRARPGRFRRRTAADRAGQGAAGRPAGAAGRRACGAPGSGDGRLR